jgi:sugar O-acyltransferase (sialic acid O-acetyltransferase NeuD family)
MNHIGCSPISPQKKLYLYGAGGSAKDTLAILADLLGAEKYVRECTVLVIGDHFYHEHQLWGIPIIPQSAFHHDMGEMAVAVGDCRSRKIIVENLPQEVRYARLIHPAAHISPWAQIGEGCVVSAGAVVTADVIIGNHAQLNLYSTVCHDARIGDFFTTAPAANVNGHCTFGDQVYLGSNAAVKQNVCICSNVTVGMGAVVVKDITEPGTYIGNPLRKLA